MNNIDPVLVFECLIYLNIFHYAVFATCETIMTTVKYVSIKPPDLNSGTAVVFTKLTIELIKIIGFQKYRKKRRSGVAGILCISMLLRLVLFDFITGRSNVVRMRYVLAVPWSQLLKGTTIAVASFLTLITMGTLVYSFGYQKLMKLEWILNIMTTMLTCTEIIFGIWSLIPKRKQFDY